MIQKSNTDKKAKELDAVIIGSGVGGLSTALCLARAGQKVLIIEQHKLPGGWCQSFYIEGYRFSPGVHYVGGLDKGGPLYDLYKGLGIANDMVFFQLNPQGYEHAFIDGERFDFPADFKELVNSLSKRFPHEKEGLVKYLGLVQTIGREMQYFSKLKGLRSTIALPWKARHIVRYSSASLESVISKYIQDPVLKKVLNIQSGDHGLPPSRASFLVHCGVMNHYFNGGFYPKGGAAAIVKAMLSGIKKHGGKIITGKRITRILIEGEQKYTATGVELENGERIFAKRVISNADPGKTFLDMVGSAHLSSKLQKRLTKTKYSISSLILFLVVDMDVRQAGLDTGNIWVKNGKDVDEDQLFEEMLNENFDTGEGFSSFFVSCTTLKDPTHYKGRFHTLEVIAFADYQRFKDYENGRKSPEYLHLKEKITGKFIAGLEKIIPGVGESIVLKELATPLTNEFYINSTEGNTYGTEKSANQIGLRGFKPETEIQNLFLCGASVSGHGISGASYSGVQTAANILKCTIGDLIQPEPEQKITIVNAENEEEYKDFLQIKESEKK